MPFVGSGGDDIVSGSDDDGVGRALTCGIHLPIRGRTRCDRDGLVVGDDLDQFARVGQDRVVKADIGQRGDVEFRCRGEDCLEKDGGGHHVDAADPMAPGIRLRLRHQPCLPQMGRGSQ